MGVLKLNGVFSVLKPPSITSSECCNLIKSNLSKENVSVDSSITTEKIKLGHGGTLDKEATGVLALGLGSGCKLLPKFIHGPKKYLCKAILGTQTDTCYLTGNILYKKSYDHITRELLENTLEKFLGTIEQVPPIYSALKYKGRRLSDMAYAGEEIPLEKLKPRIVDVFNLRCIHFQLPTFVLEISCGSGFYVRSLITDVTKEMNTCGYVDKLERTKHGCFDKEHSLTESQWNYGDIKKSIDFWRFYSFKF